MPIRLTRAVKILLIANFVAFIIQQTADQFMGGNLIGWLGLVPYAFVFEHRFWQIFTYAFLHGDVMHLFLNLLMLAFIGGELESFWGTARFVRYYFLCSLSAGVFYLLLQTLMLKGDGLHTPMVGASGAIYGLLMAYGLIFGERVLLFMMLFPMKAKYFVWVLAGLEFFTTVFSPRGGLASAAHLGGMVAGFGFLWTKATLSVMKKNRQDPGSRWNQQRLKKRRASGHLKLVIGNKGGTAADDQASGSAKTTLSSQGSQLKSDDDADHDPKTWH